MADVFCRWLSRLVIFCLWMLSAMVFTARCQTSPPLNGFVDMHTHPMSNWGFGSELFYGEADGNPAEALGSCSCVHNFVVFPFAGHCGQQNLYRNNIVDGLEPHAKVAGYPGFEAWPTCKTITHQQMWVDWIRRAYEGGLRGMVALAVNNHCLADAAETRGPNDDQTSVNLQLEKLRGFVLRHADFMEIALTAADFRRIVAANKLAVVMGVEADNLGNFYEPADEKGATYTPDPTNQEIARELDRLYDLGVRYIFPIHITNNVFGGSAIYLASFNVSNKYNTGKTFEVEKVRTDTSGIGFRLQSPADGKSINLIASLVMKYTGAILPESVMPDRLSNFPAYPDPGDGFGHRNALGLTDKGRFAISYMMKKKMLIDIDHCSEKSATEIIKMAQEINYPLNSGHNGLRGKSGDENGRTVSQYQAIQRLGGMIGLGHGGNATNFVSAFRQVAEIANHRQLCIGTDVNGFYPLPGVPAANERIDSLSLSPCLKGNGKCWDFNRDGFAHYGLFPEYIKSWERAGMTAEEKKVFFSSAEYFAQMWERCEQER